MKNRALAPLLVLIALSVTATPALATNGYEKVTSTFGSEGTGPGKFNKPTSVAVNDETGDVYVLDSGNDRVEWFSPEGAGKFKFEGEFDGSGTHSNEGKAAPTGKFLYPKGIAVDQTTGDVYVADGAEIEGNTHKVGHEVVDEFNAAGKYEGQLTGSCPAEGETPPACSEPGKFFAFGELLDVTVDSSGDVWVLEGNGPITEGTIHMQVDELNATGSALETRVLDSAQRQAVPGFAVNSVGDIYSVEPIAEGDSRVTEYQKATGEQRYNVTSSANPTATLAVIAANSDLLIDEGPRIELFKSPVTTGTPFSTFPGEGLAESQGIAVNGAKGEGTIYATQRGKDDVDVFESGPAKAPVVASESALTVGPGNNEAKFAAVVDGGNRNTTYSFEYSHEVKTNAQGEPVLNAEGELELEGIETVAGETELPAEFGGQKASSSVVELGGYRKTWYYRVVAENEESKGKPTYGKVEEYTKLPLVDNEKESSLTSTSAKLEATVNALFQSTQYTFEYATEASGGTLLGTIVKVPSGPPLPEVEGGAPTPVSVEVAGLQPGHTYFYRVVAENEVTRYTGNVNKGAPVKGPIEQVTPYGPPAIVTGAAQNVTGTAATLSGSVDPEGTSATYYFAYISETGYQEALKNGAANPLEPEYEANLAKGKASPYAEGETTPTFDLAASASPQTVGPIPADDLLPGVTYHYALVAVNKFELQTVGPDQTFTTQAGAPPLVNTGAASNVSQNTATLSGTVTTNGLQTNYGFEIGTSPNNYGPATGLGAIGGAQTAEVHVTLGELQPGTTYYYRVTATNADGTREGQPQSFTTPGFPSVLIAPASPLLIPYTSPGFPAEEKPSGTSTKTLTNNEKLSKALKQCKRGKSRTKRRHCEKAARKKYGAARKKK